MLLRENGNAISVQFFQKFPDVVQPLKALKLRVKREGPSSAFTLFNETRSPSATCSSFSRTGRILPQE